MSTRQAFPRTSLPPPPGDFRLLDGTGTVGWTVANRLGFTGFSNIAEAAAAAWVAHVALERRAAKSRGEPAPYFEPDALQLAWSDGGEWIYSAETPLARLVRPAATSPWFGIEVVLPANSSDLMVGSSAQVVYRALRRSGVQWPIRNLAVGAEGAADRYSMEMQVTEGRRAAMSQQPDARGDTQSDDVESASLDSFPASDPPKWSSLRVGPPVHSELAPAVADSKARSSDRMPPDSERESATT